MAEELRPLSEFFEECSGAPSFHREPWYNEVGDCLNYHFEDCQFYEDRVDDILTVFRRMDDDRFVGMQIKGVSAVLARFGDFHIHITADQAQLSAFFFVSLLLGENEQYELPRRRKVYGDLLTRVGNTRVNIRDLQPV